MANLKNTPEKLSGEGKLEESLQRIDDALEIMERHPGELASAEDGVKDDLRRRDREYKDAHLHSIPKPRKHLR